MTETLISVDIEAAGPIPGRYSLLSIGACLIDDPEDSFYVEMQPLNDAVVPEALSVSGFDLKHLRAQGVAPGDAMQRFGEWAARYDRPVFVGFNASFDWAFVNHYFIEYGPGGRNPFGIGALDIKAYAMGRFGSTWDDTRSSRLSMRLGLKHDATHHALNDARLQAAIFRAIRDAS